MGERAGHANGRGKQRSKPKGEILPRRRGAVGGVFYGLPGVPAEISPTPTILLWFF
jgi:hypothetical protein